MISVLISCPARGDIEMPVGIEFVVLEQRGTKRLLDVLLRDRADLPAVLAALDALPGPRPKVVAAFTSQGKRVKGRQTDVVEWIATAPDRQEPNPVPGGDPIRTRPVAYEQVHSWAGWGAHEDQEGS